MSDEPAGYAGNDTGRYEPPACPQCGRRPKVEWVNIGTYEHPDRWLPVALQCCGQEWRP